MAAAVYVMTIILMGFNLWAATIILMVVLLVIINMLGYFWLLGINANAVSLVNLVMVSVLLAASPAYCRANY